MICPQCGHEIRGKANFCDGCGHDLRQAERVAAINYHQPQSYTPKHLVDKILTSRSAIEG